MSESKKTEGPIDVSEWDIAHLNASKDYLSKADFLALDGSLHDMTVTVKKVTREKSPNPMSKQKLVDILAFDEKEKRLIGNKGNKAIIAALYGNKAKDWFGKKITLYYDPTVKFGADTVGGIRVRKQKPE